MRPDVRSSIRYSGRTGKQPVCPWTDERIRKMWGVYSGILLTHMKNDVLLFAMTWMELESVMLGEISQSDTNTL